jgi:DNA-binding NarL/FixJ family response regulator
VLLLEDEVLVARAIMRLLRKHSLDVTHAVGMRELEALSGHYDLGIFDIDLPDGSGIELAQRCLARNLVGHAVFFSATADARKIAAAQQIGELISKGEGTQPLLDHILWAIARPSGVYGNGVRG